MLLYRNRWGFTCYAMLILWNSRRFVWPFPPQSLCGTSWRATKNSRGDKEAFCEVDINGRTHVKAIFFYHKLPSTLRTCSQRGRCAKNLTFAVYYGYPRTPFFRCCVEIKREDGPATRCWAATSTALCAELLSVHGFHYRNEQRHNSPPYGRIWN
jgi:hypothetical protein